MTVELKSLITSIFPFSLWILSEVKSCCCCLLDRILILHFAKYMFPSKSVRNSRINHWNSFSVFRNKDVISSRSSQRSFFCIFWFEHFSYCTLTTAFQVQYRFIELQQGKRQAKWVSSMYFRVWSGARGLQFFQECPCQPHTLPVTWAGAPERDGEKR